MSDEDNEYPAEGEDCPNLLDLFDKLAEACSEHRLTGAAVVLQTECAEQTHDVVLFTPGILNNAVRAVGSLEMLKSAIMGSTQRGNSSLN